LDSFIHAHAAAQSQVWVVDPNRGNRAAFHKHMTRVGFSLQEQLLDRPAQWNAPAYKGRMLTYTRA
jgi:hypothetical protein